MAFSVPCEKYLQLKNMNIYNVVISVLTSNIFQTCKLLGVMGGGGGEGGVSYGIPSTMVQSKCLM